jgi:hypothetical protein
MTNFLVQISINLNIKLNFNFLLPLKGIGSQPADGYLSLKTNIQQGRDLWGLIASPKK